MKKMITAVLIAVLSLSGCQFGARGVVVEKEYEPSHYDFKKKKWIAECYEIEVEDGTEQCISRSEFDRIKVGDVR